MKAEIIRTALGVKNKGANATVSIPMPHILVKQYQELAEQYSYSRAEVMRLGLEFALMSKDFRELVYRDISEVQHVQNKREEKASNTEGERTRTNYGVDIANLLGVGLLKSGEKLKITCQTRDGVIVDCEGTIQENGSISVLNENFASPSLAAIYVFKHAGSGRKGFNGWGIWKNENGMLLSDLRKTYLDNLYGERNLESIRNANESGRTDKPARSNGRRRNATIRIDGNTFKVQSVRELCKLILKYLCDHNHIEILGKRLPYAISSRRYLLATEPIHPRGNRFIKPVEHNGYYIEGHSSYGNAIKNIRKFLKTINLSLDDLDSDDV